MVFKKRSEVSKVNNIAIAWAAWSSWMLRPLATEKIFEVRYRPYIPTPNKTKIKIRLNKFSGNKFNESKKPVSDAKLDEVISRLDKIIRLLTPVIDLRENNNKSEKLSVIEKKSKDIIKKEDKKLKTKTKTKTGDKDVKKNTKKKAKTSVKKNNKKK